MTPDLSACELCGETDSDLVACCGCNRRVCHECCQWCCEEHDNANGDWFCDECRETANEGT